MKQTNTTNPNKIPTVNQSDAHEEAVSFKSVIQREYAVRIA